MGIVGLNKYLKYKYPCVFKTKSINKFSKLKKCNNGIAIDALNFIFIYFTKEFINYIYNMKNINKIINREIILYNVIKKIIKIIIELKKNNIKTIFVFDGKYEKEKDNLIKEKKKKLNDIQYKIDLEIRKNNNGENNDDLIFQYMKKNIYILPSEIDFFKNFFNSINFCGVITAEFEAEKTCSWLGNNGYVSAIFSNDSDIFAYGCTVPIITNISNIKNEIIFEYYKINKLLKILNIDQSLLTNLCILCKNDYNTKKGYTPDKCFKNINYLKNNKKILNNIDVNIKKIYNINNININLIVCEKLKKNIVEILQDNFKNKILLIKLLEIYEKCK